MKKYYANLLGEWTDITNCEIMQISDLSGMKVKYQIERIITDNFEDKFLILQYKDKQYTVHISQIQIVSE